MACARFELKKLFLTPNEVRDRGDYVYRGTVMRQRFAPVMPPI